MRIGLFSDRIRSVFLYIWGSPLIWAAITVLCLLVGILSYLSFLRKFRYSGAMARPRLWQIKNGFFIYPVVCIVIRYLLKPFIYVKLQMKKYYGEIITEYLTNYLCFIALSAEVFSVLFVFQVVRSIAAVLAVDTAVLLGLLAVGLIKMDLRGKGM